jgi:putative oxidoreductase
LVTDCQVTKRLQGAFFIDLSVETLYNSLVFISKGVYMITTNQDLAALITRLALGVMFLAHGLLKVLVFTLPGTAQFFDSIGFPGWMAYIVGPAEVLAGVALIAGFYSRWAALASLPILIGAVVPHWANGWLFSAPNGGWEYPVFLIAIAVAVFFQPADRFSVKQ